MNRQPTLLNRLTFPFWNPHQRRLRTVWRLLGQLLILGVLATLGGLLLSPWVQWLDGPPQTALSGGLTILATVASIWAAGRWLDRRRFADFGFHLSATWWVELIFGLGLGALLMALIFAAEWAAGWVTVTETWYVVDGRTPFLLAFAQPVLLYLAVGFYEELFSRGYQLRNLAEGFYGGRISRRTAIWLATLLSSAIFGLLHLGNPNATWISSLNITLAGIFLALPVLLTGELAAPIGLHITWNLFQGNVFGFPVSGTTMTGGSVLRIAQGGPEWLTGGDFGPEAGLIGVTAMLLGMAAIWGWTRWRTGRVSLEERLAVYESRGPLEGGPDRPKIGEEGL